MVKQALNNAEYPANLEAGFLFDSRHGSRTSVKGTGIPSTPFTAARNYGNGGAFFLQGLKVIYRGERGAYGPPKNISVYGSVSQSVDQPQPFQFDTLVGINFTGFIPSRPLDALGLQAHFSRLSNIETQHETTLARVAGGRGSTVTQERNGYAFEAVGNVQLTQSIAFRPYVQYFVNPDSYYFPAPHTVPRDGVAIGFIASLSLGRFLGTSEKPF